MAISGPLQAYQKPDRQGGPRLATTLDEENRHRVGLLESDSRPNRILPLLTRALQAYQKPDREGGPVCHHS
jgi:hypothetical protein